MCVLAVQFLWIHSAVHAGQPLIINYDESKIPNYTLPDPLITENGARIQTASAWNQIRRPEILSIFSREMFGAVPGRPAKMEFDVTSDVPNALNGLARRKEVTIRLTGETDNRSAEVKVLLYLPAKSKNPVPVFLGYNFYGNHTIQDDPDITLSTSWMRNNSDKGTQENRATEVSRGTSSQKWPVEMILKRGYGLVTAYYGDIDPDFHDGWENGVHPLFYRE